MSRSRVCFGLPLSVICVHFRLIVISGADSIVILDDQGLPSLDDATLSVDALVADSTADDFGTRSFDPFGFDYGSRSSTPSIPPGFGLPHAHPLPITHDNQPPPKAATKIVPTSAPFTPSRGVAFIPQAATPLSTVSVPSTPYRALSGSNVDAPSSQAKESVKALATSTGLSNIIATQSSQPVLQSEDFPALESGKGKQTVVPASSKTPIANKKTVGLSGNIPVAQSSTKAAEKRSTPSLNIAVPSNLTPKTPGSVAVDTSLKNAASSAFPPLPISTPSTANVQSPLSRVPPKTLRLTSKTDITSAGSGTPTSVTSAFPLTFPASRQPSLASITRLDRPGTPTSEIVSDNASITSASLSRASSPPPSKVGSAPVRTTTKSMQRKQRKEAQKEKEKTELEAAAPKVEPEPEIAPIMGRKKKQKKERTVHSAAGGSTPAVSRPASPGPLEAATDELKSGADSIESVVQTSDHTQVESNAAQPSVKTQDLKGKGKAKVQRPPSPEAAPPTPEVEEDQADKPIPTPASVFQSLVSLGLIGDPNSLFFLKNPPLNLRASVDSQNVPPKLTITPEDRAALLAGLPVYKNADGPHRTMLTPNGDCVRNLTPEEEETYLELQARIAEDAGPAAFSSAKHHASNGFTLIGGRAVPNGPPSFFPLHASNTTPMDPVSKIQRDEALSYINQYVLPSLSTNSQLEKALNANALDTEMLRSSDATAWASWGSDPAVPRAENSDGVYGSSSRDGILATGLESMTAHFAVGNNIDRGQPLGNVSLLSLTDAETAMQMARKETDALEKKFNAILKKNRRLLLGSAH
jgi:CCR4-NOT transcription complex subunit 4